MTLMHRSHKRRRKDIEISPVVVGGMRINFPPRPRSALASGGALLSCVRSWNARFDGSGRVQLSVVVAELNI